MKIDWITASLVLLALTMVVIVAFEKYLPQAQQAMNANKIGTVANWEKVLIDKNLSDVSKEAKVKIVEFFSYGCKFCADMNSNIEALTKKYPNDIALLYKPIHMGLYGVEYLKGIISECASKTEKYDNVHKLLYEQNSISLSYEELAKMAKIKNISQFISCIENDETKDQIDANQQIADSLGFRGVPYTVINGDVYVGSMNINTLEEIVLTHMQK